MTTNPERSNPLDDAHADQSRVDEVLARVTEVAEAFSPGAPITSRDLFSGRISQMAKLMNVVVQRGQHGILFGERGVGKTSLAAVISGGLRIQNRLTVRVNCSAGDSFSAVWRRVMSEVSLSETRTPAGFARADIPVDVGSAETLLGEDPIAPDRVRRALEVVSSTSKTVIFVDEFDRLETPARAGFADLIKSLSDYVVDATVVIVGVADDVDELVAEHQSVARAIQEILMPRMSSDELREIATRGLTSVGMTAVDAAVDEIVKLSKGLPHYAHLLAQEAAMSAAWNLRDEVELTDVAGAVEEAIDKAQQTVKNDYLRAIYSPRKINLYPHVLRACALTHKDELGFFAPADLREPLSQLLGRRVDIPSYQQHLNAFTGEVRAHVLQKRGETRRFRYRFRDPLLEPYVLLRGLRDDASRIPAEIERQR